MVEFVFLMEAQFLALAVAEEVGGPVDFSSSFERRPQPFWEGEGTIHRLFQPICWFILLPLSHKAGAGEDMVKME